MPKPGWFRFPESFKPLLSTGGKVVGSSGNSSVQVVLEMIGDLGDLLALFCNGLLKWLELMVAGRTVLIAQSLADSIAH